MWKHKPLSDINFDAPKFLLEMSIGLETINPMLSLSYPCPLPPIWLNCLRVDGSEWSPIATGQLVPYYGPHFWANRLMSIFHLHVYTWTHTLKIQCCVQIYQSRKMHVHITWLLSVLEGSHIVHIPVRPNYFTRIKCTKRAISALWREAFEIGQTLSEEKGSNLPFHP